MKKVLKNHAAVAHSWAHQLQTYASSGPLYFHENEIFSYGSHYMLATILEDSDDNRVYFVNANSYSNTTAKHRNHVLNAIPNNRQTFYIPFPNNRLHIDTLESAIYRMIQKANECFLNQIKAKTNSSHYADGMKIISDIQHICNLFKLSINIEATQQESARIKAEEIQRSEPIRRKAREEKQLKADKERLEKWLRHEANGTIYSVPVHLRLSKNRQTIQTTKGAEVDLGAALLIWDKIRKGENVNGKHIGPFTVDEVTETEIQIGCHLINIDTIKNFLKTL